MLRRCVAVKAVRHVVRDGIRFLLRGLMRLRDFIFVAVIRIVVPVLSLALHASMLALHDVRELVRQKAIALLCTRSEFAGTEVHITANGECARAELLGRRVRFAARVKADTRQVGAETWLHSRANIIGKRTSGRLRDRSRSLPTFLPFLSLNPASMHRAHEAQP